MTIFRGRKCNSQHISEICVSIAIPTYSIEFWKVEVGLTEDQLIISFMISFGRLLTLHLLRHSFCSVRHHQFLLVLFWHWNNEPWCCLCKCLLRKVNISPACPLEMHKICEFCYVQAQWMDDFRWGHLAGNPSNILSR